MPVLAVRTRDFDCTLAQFRHGRGDPTTWLRNGEFVRATRTPHGPGTLHLRWSRHGGVETRAHGAGGAWLEARVPAMIGEFDTDDPGLLDAPDAAVASAARRHRDVRLGACGDLYHELLPTIIEQRITAGEAHRQWAALCWSLGEPAPGPFARLRLPPAAEVLAKTPSWSLHRLGIERKRAEPLIAAARHHRKFWDWAELEPAAAGPLLALLPGVGAWTIGQVLASVWGDPDAVAVGDYHHRNTVAWALAGEPRGTDDRMLELLAPYAGQRGRVLRLLGLDGNRAPKFGPKRRILPMYAW